MKESSTYQAILLEGKAEGKAEGELKEAIKILLRLGGKRFGTPSDSVRKRIEKFTSAEPVENMLDRIALVSSWDELLNSSC